MGWLTTLLIFLPVAGALVVWVVPLPRLWAGSLATLVALVEVGLWITLLLDFDFGGEIQHEQRAEWFSDLEVSYHVGLFGFSLWLVGLTVVGMAAAIAYAYWYGRERPRAYFGLMLFLTGAIVGVFCAQDLLVFYAFFEAMLIPLYVLVGAWGGAGRLRATLLFVLYTIAGSLLMLAALIAFGLQAGTFDLLDSGTSSNEWLFLGFLVAFAVKAPLFPLHGWLAETYRESPAEVAGVLSGIVSKAAVFGLLWIAIRKFPEPAEDFQVVVLVLAATGLVYGSLVAFRQPDLRGVVAYSSLAQMSLIVLGLFAFNEAGWNGAILQSVAHGLVSVALFLLAGSVERRATTGDFAALGGMAKGRPATATLLMTLGIIALAVPGSVNFAGEFLILLGVFDEGWVWAAIGAAAIVLAAMYMLRAISAVLHEARGPRVADEALDLRPAEIAIIGALTACLLALSAWPAAITDRAVTEPSFENMSSVTAEAAGGGDRIVLTVSHSSDSSAEPLEEGSISERACIEAVSEAVPPSVAPDVIANACGNLEAGSADSTIRVELP